jgi:hypothetical protein
VPTQFAHAAPLVDDMRWQLSQNMVEAQLTHKFRFTTASLPLAAGGRSSPRSVRSLLSATSARIQATTAP